MSNKTNAYTPPAALTGSMRDFRVPRGRDLLGRAEGFFGWQDLRRQNGLWPFSRSTEDGPRTVCSARRTTAATGCAASTSPRRTISACRRIRRSRQTAKEAIERYGVHSAGSPALVGNTTLLGRARTQDRRVPADGPRGAVPDRLGRGLRRHQGARPLGRPHRDGRARPHLPAGRRERRDPTTFICSAISTSTIAASMLAKIRAKDTENGIMVVTEGLFSMDSDTPESRRMQELCHEFNATLMVDVAHDLGCLGEDGRGHIGMQNMLGKVDLVMGSFSKTFASNGGFVACKNRAVKEYLRFYSAPATFSNALSPVQAATVLKAFEIIESDEGASCAAALMSNILSLRERADAGRLRLLRRSVRDRLREDGHRGPRASRRPAPARTRPDRQPGRISGRAQGRSALPHAGDGQAPPQNIADAVQALKDGTAARPKWNSRTSVSPRR